MSESSVHILVVDDEPDIRESFQEYLELLGYTVSCAADSATARRMVTEHAFDLALIDIAMPGEDGLSLARFLREHSNIALIIVASAGDAIDRIIGLEVGADDYVPKPVNLRELEARVRAVLRWKTWSWRPAEGGGQASARIPFGVCQLDPDARKLYAPDGAEIPITAMDYRLIKAFAEHPDKVLTRQRLFELTRERDWSPAERSIDLQIARLRRKIEPDTARPQAIRTVHGSGYRYTPHAR